MNVHRQSHVSRDAGVTASAAAKLLLPALCINSALATIVWSTTLNADCGRQVLALLLAGISAKLAWDKTDRGDGNQTDSPQPKPSHEVKRLDKLIAVALCCIIFFTGCLHMSRIFLLANIALIYAFARATVGKKIARCLIPSMFLALFAMPDLPEEFRAHFFIPLQSVCTTLAGELARLFIPMTYSGHIFTVNGQQMNVAPSCAGLGMWACFLFTFAIWQAFKTYRPIAYLVAFALDPILVVILNTVRLATTAIVAYAHSVRLAMEIHSNLEFILVPLGIFILWKVGARFAKTA